MSLNLLIVEGNNPKDSEVFIRAAKASCSENLKNIVLKLEPSSRVTIINPGMVRSSFFNDLSFQPGDKKENAISKKDLSDLILFLLKTSNSINYLNINLAPLKKVIDFKNK